VLDTDGVRLTSALSKYIVTETEFVFSSVRDEVPVLQSIMLVIAVSTDSTRPPTGAPVVELVYTIVSVVAFVIRVLYIMIVS
jgi:hypothetical protein